MNLTTLIFILTLWFIPGFNGKKASTNFHHSSSKVLNRDQYQQTGIRATNNILLDFTKISPRQLLEALRNPVKIEGPLNRISFADRADLNWITKKDLAEIMPYIFNRDTCKCLVSVYSSSYYPNSKAILGGHALEMIRCYRNKMRYPSNFYSCPTIDLKEINEVELWWAKTK